MLTLYGTVTEIVAETPPLPPGAVPPETPDPDAPKTWVHIHVALDAPHTGELQIAAPESAAGTMLVLGGRARVFVESI